MLYLDNKVINLTKKMSADMNYRFALDSSNMIKRQEELMERRKAIAKRSKNISPAPEFQDIQSKSAGRSLRNLSDSVLPQYTYRETGVNQVREIAI